MAALTPSLVPQKRMYQLTPNNLTASDTYQYAAGDIVIAFNPTGGALTATFTDAAAEVITPDGMGILAVALGFGTGSVAAAAAVALFADTRAKFMQNLVTVTGASGMTLLIIRR